jgi:hypothetical protein
MMKRFFLELLLLCIAVTASSVLAAETTVSQVLSNPTAFDGQHV